MLKKSAVVAFDVRRIDEKYLDFDHFRKEALRFDDEKVALLKKRYLVKEDD